MTREEAIKIIKSATVYTPEEMQALELLIPELRESEDERIRKALIPVVDRLLGTINFPFTEEQVLNWFEKQKERKPNIELIQRSWYMEGYTDGEFKREPMWNLVTGKGGPKYEKNEKYEHPKEQKPIPSREMILGIWELGNFWKENPEERDGLTQLQYIQKYWSEKCDYQKEQKPADEQFPPLEGLDAIKAKYYDEGFKNGFDEGVESVKPTEWSEEDEKMLKLIISELESEGKDVNVPELYRVEINWLKSLRPSWKPSEEQMAALAAAKIGIDTDYELLESLYEQLKAL